MRSLLAAAPDGAALLVVGDVDQLPLVGHGQLLVDIIASGAVSVAWPTEVFRQEPDRHRGPRHQLGCDPGSLSARGDCRFYFVSAGNPEMVAARILKLVNTRIPRRFGLDAGREIQVLCTMNRGGCGARALNVEFQATLNGPVTECRISTSA